ncbi:copper amine oxidase N-terminal domain-containing protein [Paenibacillus sp. N1-5-1-14]|uniref:copper amine oxidase N-terminal domain-containing protein n=1 Tax=Paenibacillus radicibacter TaxID=2972488 RepID=UPI00215989C7|nr:copper amine oxidase N-terminal domain-containing protein [Paenibacillus radicibacter]MCR8641322.1 copper amine oxidase N-terminal domain-containing protein [Paenibacillus radicibacter]
MKIHVRICQLRIAILCTFIFMVFMPAAASAQTITLLETPIKIIPLESITEQGNLVPLRSVADSLGAVIVWDVETDQAAIKRGKQQFILKLNKQNAFVNGKSYIMSEKAKIIDGQMMVPIDVFQAAFGGPFTWDKSRGLLISDKDTDSLAAHFIALLRQDQADLAYAMLGLQLKKSLTVKDLDSWWNTTNGQVNPVKIADISHETNMTNTDVVLTYQDEEDTVLSNRYRIRFDQLGKIVDFRVVSLTGK